MAKTAAQLRSELEQARKRESKLGGELYGTRLLVKQLAAQLRAAEKEEANAAGTALTNRAVAAILKAKGCVESRASRLGGSWPTEHSPGFQLTQENAWTVMLRHHNPRYLNPKRKPPAPPDYKGILEEGGLDVKVDQYDRAYITRKKEGK